GVLLHDLDHADREARADVAEPASHARSRRAEPGLPPQIALLDAGPAAPAAVAVVQRAEGRVDARVDAVQRHRDPRLAEDEAPAAHPLVRAVGHDVTPRIRAAAPAASAARSESRSSPASATTTGPRPLPSRSAAFCPIARRSGGANSPNVRRSAGRTAVKASALSPASQPSARASSLSSCTSSRPLPARNPSAQPAAAGAGTAADSARDIRM